MRLTFRNDPEPRKGPIPSFRLNVEILNTGPGTLQGIGYQSSVRILGVPLPASGLTIFTREIAANNPLWLELEYLLPPHLIEVVEQHRRGGDVSVDLRLEFLCQENNGRMRSEHVDVPPLHWSASKWRKLLSDIGFGAATTFEVVTPNVPQTGDFAEIAQHLRLAESALYGHDPARVLLECRKSIELLEKTAVSGTNREKRMADQFAVHVDYQSAPAEEEPKSARYEAVRQKVMRVLHMSAHPGFVITWDDAVFCYHTTLFLVRFYSVVAEKVAGGRQG